MLNESMLFGEIEKDLVKELSEKKGNLEISFEDIARKVIEAKPEEKENISNFFNKISQKRKCYIFTISPDSGSGRLKEIARFVYGNELKQKDQPKIKSFFENIIEFKKSNEKYLYIYDDDFEPSLDMVFIKENMTQDAKCTYIAKGLVQVVLDFQKNENPNFKLDDADDMSKEDIHDTDLMSLILSFKQDKQHYYELLADEKIRKILDLDIIKNVKKLIYLQFIDYLNKALDPEESFSEILVSIIEQLNVRALNNKVNAFDFRNNLMEEIKDIYYACAYHDTSTHLIELLVEKGFVKSNMSVISGSDRLIYLSSVIIILKQLTNKETDWFELVKKPYSLFNI